MTAGPIESSMCSPLRALDVCCFLYYFTSLQNKDHKVVFYSISAFLSTRVSFYGSTFKMDEHKYQIWLLFITFSSFIGNKTKTKPSFAGLKNKKCCVCVCERFPLCVRAFWLSGSALIIRPAVSLFLCGRRNPPRDKLPRSLKDIPQT